MTSVATIEAAFQSLDWPMSCPVISEFRHFYYENENYYFFCFYYNFFGSYSFFLGIDIFFDENPRAFQKYQLFYQKIRS